jgi:hypothetical protein
LQWTVTLFRDVPAKEIQELGNYRKKIFKRNVTALNFLGHFGKYKQTSQNCHKELTYNRK